MNMINELKLEKKKKVLGKVFTILVIAIILATTIVFFNHLVVEGDSFLEYLAYVFVGALSGIMITSTVCGPLYVVSGLLLEHVFKRMIKVSSDTDVRDFSIAQAYENDFSIGQIGEDGFSIGRTDDSDEDDYDWI